MEKLILIKYGELTTKKGNRSLFINTLNNNIKNVLKNIDHRIIKNHSRMYIETDSIELVVSKLKKIFGIHGIVICHKVNTNTDDIKESIYKILNSISFKNFKVETKRADKNFEIKSMDFSRIIGGYILKNFDCSVDVHNPEITIHIEIREDGSYIYLDEIPGLGGYPVGIQGKGLLMLSGGIDSPVAGYLSIKRGIDIDCIYFESPPHTSFAAKNKVKKLASMVNEYSGNIKLFCVPFTELQEKIYKNVPDSYNITIMRRMMYRICEKICLKYGHLVIINGESIGQVASQTLTSINTINSVTNYPVIRPVACLDKLEIIAISKRINTYAISILPYEDCCTIFLPKHPVINPVLIRCLDYENRFNYSELIEECIQNIEIITDLTTVDYNDLL